MLSESSGLSVESSVTALSSIIVLVDRDTESIHKLLSGESVSSDMLAEDGEVLHLSAFSNQVTFPSCSTVSSTLVTQLS